MPIRAVLWDVDDTLFDHTGADTDALVALLARSGPTAPRHGSPAAALAAWRAATARHWARFEAGELTFEDQRLHRVREFLAAPHLSDAEAGAWFAGHLERYEASWRLFPDTLPTLDALAASHRHAILSNSVNPIQHRKLTALGIRDRFELLLCSDDLGRAKPDPGAFHAACAALGLPPAEVLYVGDQPETDARAAHAAGLAAVWIDRTGSDAPVPEGAHRIRGLSELAEASGIDTRFGARSGIR
ncbi:HAD family hydrolase [Streptomyces sp. BI20]|uniref:HAD family hydrolase n=1 Tax=Streptomyces sp. BI20 TaxID=3403460 RepID=UPI003C712D0D